MFILNSARQLLSNCLLMLLEITLMNGDKMIKSLGIQYFECESEYPQQLYNLKTDKYLPYFVRQLSGNCLLMFLEITLLNGDKLTSLWVSGISFSSESCLNQYLQVGGKPRLCFLVMFFNLKVYPRLCSQVLQFDIFFLCTELRIAGDSKAVWSMCSVFLEISSVQFFIVR